MIFYCDYIHTMKEKDTIQSLKSVVAIVGEKAAGKGTVARMLAEASSATVLRCADIVRVRDIEERLWRPALQSEARPGGRPVKNVSELAERTAAFLKKHTGSKRSDIFDQDTYDTLGLLPPSTSRLQDVGNAIRRDFGITAIGEIVAQIALILGVSSIIIDGVRNPGDTALFEERIPERFVLVGVTANLKIREKRFLESRKRIGDPRTHEEFLALDARDKGVGEGSNGQRVADCLKLVKPENTIENNGSFDELGNRVRTLVLMHRRKLKSV